MWSRQAMTPTCRRMLAVDTNNRWVTQVLMYLIPYMTRQQKFEVISNGIKAKPLDDFEYNYFMKEKSF